MKTCPTCSKQAEPTWKLCPHCGADLKSKCLKCNNELQPEWKLCPHCGESAGKDAVQPTATAAHQSVSLSARQIIDLFECAQSGWLAEFQESFARFGAAESVTEILAALPADHLDESIARAAGNTVTEISQWLGERNIALVHQFEASSVTTEIGKRFRRHIDSLRTSTLALRKREIPDGTIGQMMRGAKTAMAESDHPWLYAIPKLGWLAGAVQGARTSYKLAEEDDKYLSAHQFAVSAFENSLLEVVPELLSQIVNGLVPCEIKFAITFNEAKKRFDALGELADRISNVKEGDASAWKELAHLTLVEVTHLPDSPLANHLHGVVLDGLGQTDEAIRYAWLAASNDDEAVGLWTNLASYLVAAERAEEALEVGGYLSLKWPDDHSALYYSAQCSCLNQRFDDADRLVKKIAAYPANDSSKVILLTVEIAVGQADLNRAASNFQTFAKSSLFDVVWLIEKARTPVFKQVLEHTMLNGVYASKGKSFNFAQAIKWFVTPHAPNDYFLPPKLPAGMLQGATQTFLSGVPRDDIVCFIDDTFWDTGKNGLALTKTALRWKEMLGNVSVVSYSDITRLGMELDDDSITFGSGNTKMSLSCHKIEFAEGLYRYLTAVAVAFA